MAGGSGDREAVPSSAMACVIVGEMPIAGSFAVEVVRTAQPGGVDIAGGAAVGVSVQVVVVGDGSVAVRHPAGLVAQPDEVS